MHVPAARSHRLDPLLVMALAYTTVVSLAVVLLVEAVPTMLVPIGIASIPLVAPTRWAAPAVWTAILFLLLFCGFAILSVGVFFVPGVILLLIAASRRA